MPRKPDAGRFVRIRRDLAEWTGDPSVTPAMLDRAGALAQIARRLDSGQVLLVRMQGVYWHPDMFAAPPEIGDMVQVRDDIAPGTYNGLQIDSSLCRHRGMRGTVVFTDEVIDAVGVKFHGQNARSVGTLLPAVFVEKVERWCPRCKEPAAARAKYCMLCGARIREK